MIIGRIVEQDNHLGVFFPGAAKTAHSTILLTVKTPPTPPLLQQVHQNRTETTMAAPF